MLHHPGRPDLGCDSVEDLGGVARDDQNEVVRSHLNDVERTKSIDFPGSRHDFPFSASEQICIRWFPEVQVVDDRSGHFLTLTGVEAPAPAPARGARRSCGRLARM